MRVGKSRQAVHGVLSNAALCQAACSHDRLGQDVFSDISQPSQSAGWLAPLLGHGHRPALALSPLCGPPPGLLAAPAGSLGAAPGHPRRLLSDLSLGVIESHSVHNHCSLDLFY